MLGRVKGRGLDFCIFYFWEHSILSLYGNIFLFCGPWWFLCLPLIGHSLTDLPVLVLVLKQKYFITPITTKPHLSFCFEFSHIFWSISKPTQLELYTAWKYNTSILFSKPLKMIVETRVGRWILPGLLQAHGAPFCKLETGAPPSGQGTRSENQGRLGVRPHSPPQLSPTVQRWPTMSCVTKTLFIFLGYVCMS